MPRCLLALGSNRGDRRATLANTCAQISALPDGQVLARSRWHATPPIGGSAGQDEFLNGALLLETAMRPAQLAAQLHAIESRLGRKRIVRWDARLIDIDVLLYDEESITTDELTIPHPRMGFRRFVLEPAVEIAGQMVHPTSGWTLAALLAHLERAPRLVSVTARQPLLAEWLLANLQQSLGCAVWPTTGKKQLPPGVSPSGGGVEFNQQVSGSPPVVVSLSTDEVVDWSLARQRLGAVARPALVIALDPDDAQSLLATAVEAANGSTDQDPEPRSASTPESTDWLDPAGCGPMARITAADPQTVLQEALAAVRCVWPDVE